MWSITVAELAVIRDGNKRDGKKLLIIRLFKYTDIDLLVSALSQINIKIADYKTWNFTSTNFT